MLYSTNAPEIGCQVRKDFWLYSLSDILSPIFFILWPQSERFFYSGLDGGAPAHGVGTDHNDHSHVRRWKQRVGHRKRLGQSASQGAAGGGCYSPGRRCQQGVMSDSPSKHGAEKK